MKSDKALLVLAKRLYNLGLKKESIEIINLKKIYAMRTDEELELKANKSPAPQISWPWEAWNSLSPAIRQELYYDLSDASWIPIIGIGPQATTFLLKVFEGKTQDASIDLAFIIISFLLNGLSIKKIPPHLGKGNLSNTIYYIVQNIKNELKIKNISVDLFVDLLNELIDRIMNALSNSQSESLKQTGKQLKPLSENISKQLKEADITSTSIQQRAPSVLNTQSTTPESKSSHVKKPATGKPYDPDSLIKAVNALPSDTKLSDEFLNSINSLNNKKTKLK
jgi:methyl-accepting chemotaxis protein